MIYTVTLNPALDKTVEVKSLRVDQVNRVSALRVDAGGKGINVSKVIAKLGGESKALTILGGNTGKAISSALDSAGIPCLSFNVAGETRTNLKVVDPELKTNTDINEPGPVVDPATLDSALWSLSSIIDPGDIVVLSGSLPKGAPEATYATWTAVCQKHGARVLLDADGEAFKLGLGGKPYLVKPNIDELERLVGHSLPDQQSVIAAARDLIQNGVQRVVVSMGGDGALFITESEAIRAHSPKVKVSSTVGAGDSVVASLAFALATHMSTEDTIVLAMATGAANVMSEGTQAAEISVIDSLKDQVTFETA